MTQKQIDTLKELGFKKFGKTNYTYYSRVFNTVDFGVILVSVDEDVISISTFKDQLMKPHIFTLTKLREIVTKLEKL